MQLEFNIDKNLPPYHKYFKTLIQHKLFLKLMNYYVLLRGLKKTESYYWF